MRGRSRPVRLVANAKLAEARRRLTWRMRRRRGRAGDPEWDARRLLRRNAEDLTGQQRDTLEPDLTDIGTYGRQILAAWKAKEKLRALARTQPARSQTSHRLHQFYDWCAEHSYLPELVTLAETVQAWWAETEALIQTGVTNEWASHCTSSWCSGCWPGGCAGSTWLRV